MDWLKREAGHPMWGDIAITRSVASNRKEGDKWHEM